MGLKRKRTEIFNAWDNFQLDRNGVTYDDVLALCDDYRELVRALNKQRKQNGKRIMRVYDARLTLRYLLGARQ